MRNDRIRMVPQNRFISLAKKSTLPPRRDPGYADALRILHSAILGLCALIESVPYSVEPWMPPLTEGEYYGPIHKKSFLGVFKFWPLTRRIRHLSRRRSESAHRSSKRYVHSYDRVALPSDSLHRLIRCDNSKNYWSSTNESRYQDTWHKDQLLFDEDRLQNLSTMLVGTSYCKLTATFITWFLLTTRLRRIIVLIQTYVLLSVR